MGFQVGITSEGLRHHLVQQYVISPQCSRFDFGAAISDLLVLDDGTNGVDHVVIAFKPELLAALLPDETPPNGHSFASLNGPRFSAVSTQDDVFLWFQSAAPEDNLIAAMRAVRALRNVANLADETTGFIVHESRDLTGFEDGTENPDADEAPDVAIVAAGPGAGSSYVFAQRWVHDLDAFDALPTDKQEAVFGRTKDESVELDPLPDRSHVERVVIEEAGEELEIYRRSFPYGSTREAGLFFLAFSNEPNLVERMLARMFGIDGPSDRMIEFSRPVSGANYIAPAYGTLELLASFVGSEQLLPVSAV